MLLGTVVGHGHGLAIVLETTIAPGPQRDRLRSQNRGQSFPTIAASTDRN
jgi:hypothetical protein